MEWALFSSDGMVHLGRWVHFVAGVIWIGVLYYFNFIQVPFFAEADGPTKSNAIQKLVPRALKWFRYGALVTFLSGLYLLYARGMQNGGHSSFMGPWGLMILTGALLGTIMFLNVWLVIWPNQKIVIASTTAVAQGGQADPRAADAGARALVASRTNALFSMPMLFFMGAASHLPIMVNPDRSFSTYWIVTLILVGVIEFNALKGKLVGPLKSIVGVIHVGLALALVMYALLEVLTK